jgi:hypothetical protein
MKQCSTERKMPSVIHYSRRRCCENAGIYKFARIQRELEMNTSNNNHLNIHDLPNEILFIIANELNIGDVYSLIDIDERFAQIVLDPLYIHTLDMTTITMKSYFDYTFSIDSQILSRICSKILPQIHSHVKKLTIEQNSMERILTLGYSQLNSLSLVNFEEKILFQYLTGILLNELISSLFFLH